MQFTKEDLTKDIDKYSEILFDIEIKFGLYNCIFEKINDNNFDDIIKKYGALFPHVCTSLIATVIVRLCSLLMDDKNSKNIYKLIRCVESNRKLIVDDSKYEIAMVNVKNILEKNASILNKLKKYRDKGIAHLDTAFFHDQETLYSISKLTKEDYEQLLATTRSILDGLWALMGKDPMKLEDYYVNDSEKLFQDLAKLNSNIGSNKEE